MNPEIIAPVRPKSTGAFHFGPNAEIYTLISTHLLLSERDIEEYVFSKITAKICSMLRFDEKLNLPKNPALLLSQETAKNNVHRSTINTILRCNLAREATISKDYTQVKAARVVVDGVKKTFERIFSQSAESSPYDAQIKRDCAEMKTPENIKAADFVVASIKKYYPKRKFTSRF